MRRFDEDKKTKINALKKMRLPSFSNNKYVNLEYVFSGLSGENKTEKIFFKNILISGQNHDKLLSSRYLVKASFTKKDHLAANNISLDVRLYTEEELKNEKIDRNNDYAYLFYKDFLLPKIKDKKDPNIVDLNKIIKGKKSNGKDKKATKSKK